MVTRETSVRSALLGLGLTADPDVVSKLLGYAEILREEAIPKGFLGPNEGPRILSRHIFEALALAPHLPAEGALIDVGSGAGLPGVPLACVRAERVCLLESLARRAGFLSDVSAQLDLGAEVIARRAEVAARSELREAFRVATSRALASPASTLELSLPFVEIGGVSATLLTPLQTAAPPATAPAFCDPTTPRGSESASAPPLGASVEAPDETQCAPPPGSGDFLTAMNAVAGQLGGGDPRLLPLEVPGGDGSRWVMIVNKLRSTPDRFPRRTGVPSRRPLG